MEIYVNLKDVVEHLRNSPLIPQNAKGAVVLDAEAIPAADVVDGSTFRDCRAVAFLTMQDNLTNHNNDVMRKTISFIVGEQEAQE